MSTREVAMRKVLGASRRQLVLQFMGESILFAFLALLLAFALAEAAQPFFNSFVGKDLELTDATRLWTAVIVLGITIMVGLAGGAYPALLVSRLRPFNALGGRENIGRLASFFREGLVIFQFAASIGLIISAAVVYGQNQFASDMALGYDSSNLIVIRNVNRGPDENERIHRLLSSKLHEIPGVPFFWFIRCKFSVCIFLN